MIPLPQSINTHPGFTLTVLLFVAVFIFCNPTLAEDKNEELREITREEFNQIIEKHQEWFKVYDTHWK